MKKITNFFYAVFFLLITLSCSEAVKTNKTVDPDVTHEGDKWKIVSADYSLVDQSTGGQTIKNGSKTNPGFFYFTTGAKGSFEFDIDNYHKEDIFNYTESSGNVTILNISQNVNPLSFSQNVIALSGDRVSTTSISLNGTITKQSASGQFVLTLTNVTLAKE